MKISQAEARRLKKRVAELEQERSDARNKWTHHYPGGVHMGSMQRTNTDWLFGRLDASQMLGRVIVVKVRDAGELDFYAVK